MSTGDRIHQLLALQRALLGAVHPNLRSASIEADSATSLVRLRFEFDETIDPHSRESCSVAASEVIADFPPSWNLEEHYVVVPMSAPLSPLHNVAYRRAESLA